LVFKHASKCCPKSALTVNHATVWVFFNMCMFYHM
jgi:hypothetical protein